MSMSIEGKDGVRSHGPRVTDGCESPSVYWEFKPVSSVICESNQHV